MLRIFTAFLWPYKNIIRFFLLRSHKDSAVRHQIFLIFTDKYFTMHSVQFRGSVFFFFFTSDTLWHFFSVASSLSSVTALCVTVTSLKCCQLPWSMENRDNCFPLSYLHLLFFFQRKQRTLSFLIYFFIFSPLISLCVSNK